MKKSIFAHLHFSAQANQVDSRDKTISRGAQRACQLVILIGLVAAIAALAALTGCVHSPTARYSPPSIVPVATALSSTRTEITSTRQAIERAARIAGNLAPVIPAANRAEFAELTEALSFATSHVQAADSSAAATATNLFVFDAAVTNQTATLNKTTDRLNYIEPKYQGAVGLIWKWRLIAMGVIGSIIAFLVIKYGSRLAVLAASIAAKVP